MPNLLRNVLDLNEFIRLHDPKYILLEKGVVQRREVRADRRVSGELCYTVNFF